MKLIKYPSIPQFRTVVSKVKHWSECNMISPPKLNFSGHVKLHGSNCSVAYNGVEFWSQSRESILDTKNRNRGFYGWAEENKDYLISTLKPLLGKNDAVVMYGEWCGGGIQKGVALNGLDKFFCAFDVCVTNPDQVLDHGVYVYKDTSTWITDKVLDTIHNEKIRLYNVKQFPKYDKVIDFSNPHESINSIIKDVESVEKKCPVGISFGKDGCGEGIVYSAILDGELLQFKVKGEKHSVTKVKTLAPVDMEKVNSVNEFCEYAVTENRIEQGIFEVSASSIEHTGKLLKWVMQDIHKEEGDVLAHNKLTMKDISSVASAIIKKYYFDKLK